MRMWAKIRPDRGYEAPSGLMMKLLKPPLRCAMADGLIDTLEGGYGLPR